MFKTEYIIIGIVALIAIYIIIEASVNSKKIKAKKKDAKKVKIKPGDNQEEIELKAVISPTIEDVERQMNAFELNMEDVARESIEDERNEKTAYAKEQARLRNEEQEKHKQKEQDELEKEVSKLRNQLNQLPMTEEEQTFMDELEDASPEIKAVLFADLLKRKN